ncbi:MAG: TIGR00296 family protein [Nanoarchaeota archaeon]
MISEEDGKKLLEVARNSIEGYFSSKEPNIQELRHLNKEQGIFVTLQKRGTLRGCIGFPEPVMPLYKAIVEAAKSAAFKDPRFPPIKKEELDDIHIEVSVLTVPEKIKKEKLEDVKEKIQIGKHGLVIKHPYGSGLLLPQVPVEQNWNIDEYLKNLCYKAGLPTSAWQREKSELYKFQAQIFSEVNKV